MTGSSRPARPGRDALIERVVEWGRLEFADFARLDPAVLRALPDLADPDWPAALNNTPEVWRRLKAAGVWPATRSPESAAGAPSLTEIRAAQSRLVRRFWRELLTAKAPALYDALPWHDLDLEPVLCGRRLWQTRFLLAGGHSLVTACRLRRSAGVIVIEPNPGLARYLERKAEMERLKKLRVLPALTALPARAADLALVGPRHWPLMPEIESRAGTVVLLDTDPLAAPDSDDLAERGWRGIPVRTRFGPARAWTREAQHR